MSILGTGIDIVEIDRMEKIISQWQNRFLQKAFTPEEIAYCNRKAQPASSFAGRFAAKEAFAKALGSGLGEAFSWKDFSVAHSASGRPIPILSDRMKKKLKGKQIHLSISHTKQYAIATVIIENE